MQFLRSKTFDVLWGLWTFLFLPTMPLLMLLGEPTKYIRRCARIWAYGVLFMLKYVVGLKHNARGQGNILTEPCIIICNHQSPWETVAFLNKFPDIAVVAKTDLLRIPVFGWFLKNYPMIMIERGTKSKAIQQLIDGSRAAIKTGRSILIFPEGTRKRVSDKVEFKRGLEILYSELNVPVLPVAVNSGVFWGPGNAFKYRGTITMSYLPPIMPGLSPSEFRQIAEATLEKEKARLVNTQ
jgi:1-acyl-sn-glycerol-3-phosphate acyltransferase